MKWQPPTWIDLATIHGPRFRHGAHALRQEYLSGQALAMVPSTELLGIQLHSIGPVFDYETTLKASRTSQRIKSRYGPDFH